MTSSDVVVAQLWRYPVKSMQGERLPAVEIQVDGVDGDRRWGVRDERTGRVLTGRREARLLEAAAILAAGSEPVIELPDGTVLVGRAGRHRHHHQPPPRHPQRPTACPHRPASSRRRTRRQTTAMSCEAIESERHLI